MILQSIKKQKKRFVLILIQLFVSAFCLCFGLGFLELNISHIRDVKSVFSYDTLYNIVYTDRSFSNFTEEEKNSIKSFHNDIRNNENVAYAGSYDKGYIFNKDGYPDKLLKESNVLVIDDDILNIILNKEKLNLKDDFSISIGKHIKPFMKDNEERNLKTLDSNMIYDINVGNLIDSDTGIFSPTSKGKISHDINDCDDYIIFKVPKGAEFVLSDSFLIKLKDESKCHEFKEYIEELSKKYNLTTYTHTIEEEVDEYIQVRKIPMIFSLVIAFILIILSSLGLIGVVLSSILRRKYEFGIRYALGCTCFNLLKLVMGEILVIFGIGSFFGILLAFIISLFIDGIKIGILAASMTIGIMFIFCMLSSIIPIVKIMKLEPIKLINMGGE